MKALVKYQNELVESNRREYGNDYDAIEFVSYSECFEIDSNRSDLLLDLQDKITWNYKNTKCDTTQMSPGCKLCAEGQWSCLFINGKCNCNCFYCPAPQTDIGEPVTQTLTFDDPITYVNYIKKFNFKGVSFSGGEPFLTYDKVKLFLETLRRELPSDLYIWMYTNGTRVEKWQLEELAKLGLNEIRYDIGATDYNLKAVKQAIGIIPNVTVEIPAVPDEIEVLKESIVELAKAGLSFMNLHQLRLTPHNLKNLTSRGYHFTHGQRVTVPASEIAAIEIIKFVKDNNLNLPINYCSFVYKNRFQKSGLRKKLAALIDLPNHEITENGYLRHLWVELNNQSHLVVSELSSELLSLISIDVDLQRVQIPSQLLNLFDNQAWFVKYVDMRILESDKTITTNSLEMDLGRNRLIQIEWADACISKVIQPMQHNLFLNIIEGQSPQELFDDESLFSIYRFEQIEQGLADIY